MNHTGQSFLVARCRNERARGLDSFGSNLNSFCPLLTGRFELLDPEVSIVLESRMREEILGRIRAGNLNRMTGLDWDAVATRLSEVSGLLRSEKVCVFLCNYPDFAFKVESLLFASSLQGLLDFDNDTVLGVSEDCSWGLGVDRYVDEFSGETKFTMDAWDGCGLRNVDG